VWGQQKQLDARALELASGTSAVLNQHLNECRDRYLATQVGLNELKVAIENNRKEREAGARRIYQLLWRGGVGLVLLLLVIIGYLIDKGGLPMHHP
jgi:hypothetical protein